MKRGLRISAWILALLVVIVISAAVAVQSPAVQTAIGRRIASKIEKRTDADISVGSISITPFSAILIRDLVVLDKAPCVPGADTLFYVSQLSVRFSLGGLLHGEGAYVNRMRLDGGSFHLVIEPGENEDASPVANVNRVLRLAPENPDSGEAGWGNILQARHVYLNDIAFRMDNVPMDTEMREKGIPPVEDAIDWNHLRATLMDGEVGNLKIADSRILGSDARLHILETGTGWELKEVTAASVSVGEGAARLEDARIYDGCSSLNLGHLSMEGRLSQYVNFVDEVVFDGLFLEGSILDMRGTLGHIAAPLKEIGVRWQVKGGVRGPVNRLATQRLILKDLDSGLRADVSGEFVDAVNIEDSRLDFTVRAIEFDMKGLSRFLNSWSPGLALDFSKMARGEDFRFSGTVNGPLQKFAAKGEITSGVGSILADFTIKDVISQHVPILIGGSVETKALHLGRMLGSKDLGPASLKARLAIGAGEKDTALSLDTLSVASLEALGYTYGGISASASLSHNRLVAKLSAEDPNLRLSFSGHMDLDQSKPGSEGAFELNLPLADLHALNLMDRDVARIALTASGNIGRDDRRNAAGAVRVSDIVLESSDGRKEIGNLNATAYHRDSLYGIHLSSPFADLGFDGNGSSIRLASDIGHLIFKEADEPETGTYKLSFTVKEAQDILSFIKPGIYIEKGTGGQLVIPGNGQMYATVSSGRLAIYNRFIKGLEIKAEREEGGNLNAVLSGESLSLGGTQLTESRLEADATLTRQRNGKVSFEGRILPSSTCINGTAWSLSSKDISFFGGSFSIDDFIIRSGGESMTIDGGYSPDRADTLRVRLDNFDLATINTFIDGIPPIGGYASGRARLISPSSPMPGLIASIQCDSVSVADRPLGALNVRSTWDEDNSRFAARLFNRLEGKTTIDAKAYLAPSTMDIKADATLSGLNIGYAAPILESVFSTFEGALSGEIGLEGKPGELNIHSNSLSLSGGRVTLDYTGVPYTAEGSLSLDNIGLHFTPLTLADGKGGTGRVEGLIDFRNLRDLGLDLRIPFENIHAIDIPLREGEPFFGSVYGSGRVDVTGSLSSILLTIDANTRSGDFHIPLGSFGESRSRELLTFTNDTALENIDPYERFISSGIQETRKEANLDVRLRVNANPGTNVYLDVDNESSLRASGLGVVDIVSRASQGLFTINGNYSISEGMFHFSAMNLVSRNFSILDGSSLRFNGELMDTDLNVNGIYSTKASLSPLTSEEASSSRRTVNCGISITGKLRNPVLGFSVDVPDLNPTMQAQVDAALSTEDRIQKQFIYLLIASSFLPSEESGISTGGSDVLFSNVSSIMSGQLNNIFRKLDIPLDLGLNYKATQAGDNLFDVAVSTQLFNNRVIVNGTVGNREELGGTASSEVAGDIDIEIKLNRPGSLRLNLFSHSADKLSSYLDNSQRHGGGLAYQMEFNTFAELFRELFTPRKAREEKAKEALLEPGNVVLQIDSSGKAYEIR